MVPACRMGNLTNELPQECQTANTGCDTPPVTVYRHGADLLLCYPLMSNVTLEHISNHFNVLGQTLLGNPPQPSIHTANAQFCAAVVVAVSQK